MNLWLKIAIPVVAVVVLALAAYFIFLQDMLTLRTINRAFAKLDAEITERIDGSPLKAVSILMDTAKDGKVSVGFEYRDYWNSEVSGAVDILSNTEDREFAILADLLIYGEKIDLEAYINKDRIAVGTKLLDDNYYGFRYSSFRSDIKIFGDLIGLDKETMDILADAVDMISDALNMEAGESDGIADISAYTNLFKNFSKSVEMTTERERIESGGSTVRSKRTDFLITSDSFLTLLNDFIEVLEDDEDLRKQFNSVLNNQLLSSAYGGMSYSEMLREIRNFARDFERNFTGDITISFFTGKADRLLRFEIRADVRYDKERVRVSAIFDFGSTVSDRWSLNFSVSSGSTRNSLRIVWDYRERSNGLENIVTVTVDGEDPVTLKSVWSPRSGDFSLSYEDRWSEGEITGSFKDNDNGFVLEIDNFLTGYNEYLTLNIKADAGAQIRRVDFINLDRWGDTLLDRLEDLIYSFAGGGSFPSGW